MKDYVICIEVKWPPKTPLHLTSCTRAVVYKAIKTTWRNHRLLPHCSVIDHPVPDGARPMQVVCAPSVVERPGHGNGGPAHVARIRLACPRENGRAEVAPLPAPSASRAPALDAPPNIRGASAAQWNARAGTGTTVHKYWLKERFVMMNVFRLVDVACRLPTEHVFSGIKVCQLS